MPSKVTDANSYWRLLSGIRVDQYIVFRERRTERTPHVPLMKELASVPPAVRLGVYLDYGVLLFSFVPARSALGDHRPSRRNKKTVSSPACCRDVERKPIDGGRKR